MILDYAIYTRGYEYTPQTDYIPDYSDAGIFAIWQKGYNDKIRGKKYPTVNEYYGVNTYAEYVKFERIP